MIVCIKGQERDIPFGSSLVGWRADQILIDVTELESLLSADVEVRAQTERYVSHLLTALKKS